MPISSSPEEVVKDILETIQKEKERLQKRLQDTPVGLISKSAELVIEAKTDQLDLIYERIKAKYPTGS